MCMVCMYVYCMCVYLWYVCMDVLTYVHLNFHSQISIFSGNFHILKFYSMYVCMHVRASYLKYEFDVM